MLPYLSWFIDVILHLDTHLQSIIADYGAWTYGILFLIIFLETGFVVTPFLPGDSLLFAAGAFAALGSLHITLLILLLWVAAVFGDTVNYHIGKYIGPRAFTQKHSRFLNKAYLDRTSAFCQKHGGKTIFLARFVPIIRTFAPFVVGIGRMNYFRFLSYNVLGGLVWVLLFTLGGYYFGNLPFVKEHFTLFILAIIVVSLIPVFKEIIHHFRAKSNLKE